MAQKNSKKENTTELKAPELIIHQINQINADRSPKDIEYWRTAHKSAENIYYPNRSRLIDLYSDVVLDGHLTGIWAKRSGDTINKQIKYVSQEGKEIEGFEALFDSEEWFNLLTHIMDAKLWGLSGIQFIPGASFNYELIPRKHILIEKGLIKINQSDQEGRAYDADPFIWVIGNKDDLGLLLKCSFYALIKKGNFGDWAQYSEIFGQPIRVIKYDAYDDKTRIQLKQVLDDSGSSLAIMIPKQAEFDIMDGKTSNGNGELQEKLKNACNNEMSICILGNTETTSSDNGGSNAKAITQAKEQDIITRADMRFLLAQINDQKLINILRIYGYPVQDGGKFVIQQETEPAVIKTQIDLALALRQAGTPIADDYLYTLANIPKPADYIAQIAKIEAEKESFKTDLTPPQKVVKKGNNDPDDLSDSILNRLRLKIADFFDPAP